MFDELSTEGAEYQAPRPSTEEAEPSLSRKFHNLVKDVLEIENEQVESYHPVIVVFVGKLKIESHLAFEQLEAQLADQDFRPQLMINDEGKHTIVIIQGRFNTTPRAWWINAVLLTLTILTTMWAGAQIDGKSNILLGLPYALSVMLILGSHELGHYFAARYHKVAVTLPYFIPIPPIIGLFGTLGAFIQLREPMRNRKQLFDVGVAGPLAGLIFAIPILLIGVATAKVESLPTAEGCASGDDPCGYILEGNSIVYVTAKYIFHGEFLPSKLEDMTINQLSFAGWTGLFVTGLNLLPVGQLDGGHVLYTLLGRRAKKVYYPALIFMVLLALNNSGWFLWVILLVLFGRVHAVPMDDITPIDPIRRWLGIFTLFVFVLVFVPSPINIVFL